MTEQARASSRERGLHGLVTDIGKMVDCMIPPEQVRQHFRNSRVEFWKGIRALIDVRIDQISRKGEQQKGASVTVE